MTHRAPFAQFTSGVERRVVEGSGCRFLEIVHPPGMRLPAHDHADHGIETIVAGNFHERIGRRAYTRTRGSVLVKPAGSVHANEYGSVPTRTVLLQLPVSSRLLAEWDFDSLITPAEATGSIAANLEALFARAVSEARQTPFEVDDAVCTALGLLANRSRPRRRRLSREMQRARDHIVDGPCLIDFAELARSVDLSPSAFAHAFRRRYGCSPSDLFRRRRVDRAMYMLSDLERPMPQVAAAAGFADQAHMIREFRRFTGSTPGTLRRSAARRR